MNEKEALKPFLEIRLYLYRLFSAVFGGSPTQELFLTIREGDQTGILDLFASSEGEENPFKRLVQATPEEDCEKGRERLAEEYTKLLVGPKHLEASPWEAPYVGVDGLLFQESTLKVRHFYAKYGFIPAMLHQVSDDHIALMMGFMSRMSEKCIDSFAKNDDAGFGKLVRGQSAFIHEHLLSWIPEYSKRLKECGSEFYSAAADGLLRFLKEDLVFLETATTADLQKMTASF